MLRARKMRRAASSTLAVLSLLLPLPAAAQLATPLDTVVIERPGAHLATVPVPMVRGPIVPSFGVAVSYAHDLERPEVVGPERSGLHQATFHAIAGLDLLDRLVIDVELPVTFEQSDDAGSGLRDLRAGIGVEAFEPDGGLPGAMVRVSVFAPTGNEDAYLGAPTARAYPQIIVGGEPGPIVWSTAVSAMIDPSGPQDLDVIGNEVRLQAGVAGVVGPISVGLESMFGVAVDGDRDLETTRAYRGETLGVFRAKTREIEITIAGGPGYLDAPGAPTFRGLVGVGGFYDPPPERGAARFGNQSTARAAAEERARARAEHADAGAAGAESVAEARARRAKARARAASAAKKEARPVCAEPDCPPDVQRAGKTLALSRPVLFVEGGSKLDASSEPLLAAVAALLQKNPAIARVGVDGHTDNQGSDKRNLELSRARAMSVVRWLTEHGVDPRRVEARGYGARQPVATNDTEEGRAKNRRVEFVILGESPSGEAGWIDGTLPEAGP